MENRINQIMTLADGSNYVVVKQAIYKNESYYAVVGIADDEETLLDKYAILKEVEYEGQTCVEEVEDPAVFKLVCEYLGILKDEDWVKLAGEQK